MFLVGTNGLLVDNVMECVDFMRPLLVLERARRSPPLGKRDMVWELMEEFVDSGVDWEVMSIPNQFRQGTRLRSIPPVKGRIGLSTPVTLSIMADPNRLLLFLPVLPPRDNLFLEDGDRKVLESLL